MQQTDKKLDIEEKDRRYASTLGKGLRILRSFRPDDAAIGNREIARRTGLPSATVSRLTYTLVKHGFLIQVHPSEAFKLGPAAISLGYTARSGFSFLTLAEPLMRDLAEDVSAMVGLCILDEGDTMLARVWRPANRASIWLSEGFRIPAERSAAMRAILAVAPEGEADTEEIRTDRQNLQTRGFITSLGRWHKRVNSCAVPFAPDRDNAPYAFLCGAENDELDAQRLEQEVGPKLVAKVNALKQGLGLPA